ASRQAPSPSSVPAGCSPLPPCGGGIGRGVVCNNRPYPPRLRESGACSPARGEQGTRCSARHLIHALRRIRHSGESRNPAGARLRAHETSGVTFFPRASARDWIPAFAGMTPETVFRESYPLSREGRGEELHLAPESKARCYFLPSLALNLPGPGPSTFSSIQFRSMS